MKFLTHHSNYSTHYLKDQTCHSDHHFKNHLNRLIRLPINHRIIHHIKLFSIFIFICLINLTDCARVYKGKKHTTNSPVYFISAPFLPNQPINNFPPPLSSPQFSHSSNVISSVYNNLMLTSSTTKSPLMMVTKSIEQNAKVSSSNQLDTLNSFNQTAGLQASIAKYLLNASANPNSFINKFNASAPPTDRIKTKIKLKRKKLNKNSTINISQPVRTINVDFSIADLKRTFDNLKPPELDSSNVTPNRVNDQFPIDRTSLNRALLNKPSNQQFSSNHPNVSPLPARLMNRMDLSKPEATTKNSSNFLKEKPLNILGEIILNSLQSKFHNLPLRFLSNGPPSQVLLSMFNFKNISNFNFFFFKLFN